MDVIREVGNDDLKFIFIKDESAALVEALYVKGFSEERYKKLRRYIKERLGEEFSGVINLDSGKALVKVLLIGVDQVGQSLINDVVDNEISKVDSWMSNGVIKELIDKVVSEAKEAKKTKKSRRKKKSKKTRAKSKGKRKKKSKKRSSGSRKSS
ncbi:hypothetical protein [Vulcanisaeta distributa]|uniref:Uncharacterized protein n=1 Tax=Vulcanisaeta distributa (strain DSM 14429 / JCM 11212 / NBRC 100878 / IC-017) TaxID=572478 RepID=E1QPL4_VULDI|nr:hypothetical protein [Vulcanisaeta distributa]ADN50310.1 hypothetical protein Vdis_0920 [Vulcanisaeta distributa DSM 14429]